MGRQGNYALTAVMPARTSVLPMSSVLITLLIFSQISRAALVSSVQMVNCFEPHQHLSVSPFGEILKYTKYKGRQGRNLNIAALRHNAACGILDFAYANLRSRDMDGLSESFVEKLD